MFQPGWVGISGRSKKRCELAAQHGASAVFNVAMEGVDVVTETLQATDQRGVDVVFDCGGTQATIDTATHAVRRGGMIMNLAAGSTNPVIDMPMMLFKEVTLASAYASLNMVDYTDVLTLHVFSQTAWVTRTTIPTCSMLSPKVASETCRA